MKLAIASLVIGVASAWSPAKGASEDMEIGSRRRGGDVIMIGHCIHGYESCCCEEFTCLGHLFCCIVSVDVASQFSTGR